MKKTRIPSPARSVGPPVTPRRYKPRASRSVGSPALSNASGRLSTLVQKIQEENMDSFALSPVNRKSVLSDNTDIDLPKRKSWWKKLDDNSRDVMEVVHKNTVDEVENVLDYYLDEDTLTQEKLHHIMDIPESSDSESIASIVLPQRRLFTHKDSHLEKNLWPNVKSREALAKLDKTQVEDKTLHVETKKLFGQKQQTVKPTFPKALITSPNKTLTNDELTNFGPKKLFRQEPSKETKRSAFPLPGVIALAKEVNEPGTSERRSVIGKPMFSSTLIASPNKTLSNDELSDVEAKKLFRQKHTKKRSAFISDTGHDSEKEANEPGTSGHRNLFGQHKKRTKFNFPALSIEHSMADEEQSGVKFDEQNEKKEEEIKHIDENRSVVEGVEEIVQSDEENEQSDEENRDQEEKSIEIDQYEENYEQEKENSEVIGESFAEKQENDEGCQTKQTLEKKKETNDQFVEVSVELNEDVQEKGKKTEQMDQDDQKIEDETKTHQNSIQHLENKENAHIKDVHQNENLKDQDNPEIEDELAFSRNDIQNSDKEKNIETKEAQENEEIMDQDKEIEDLDEVKQKNTQHSENEENIHTKDVQNNIDQFSNVIHDTINKNIITAETQLQRLSEKDEEIDKNQKVNEGDRSFVGDAEENKQSDEEGNEPEDVSLESGRHEENDELAEENCEDIIQSVVEEQENQQEESDHEEENEEKKNKTIDHLLSKEQENENEESGVQNIEDNYLEMEENEEDNDMSVAEEQENEESDDQYVGDIDEDAVEEDENNDQSVAKEQEDEYEESDHQNIEDSEGEMELNYGDDDISVAEEQRREHNESSNENLEAVDDNDVLTDQSMEENEPNDHSDEQDEDEQENYEEIDQDDQEFEGEAEDNKANTQNSENEENIHTEDAQAVINESRNVTHDTTGRNRKKIQNQTKVKSPEALLNNVLNPTNSFVHRGRNTSIRITKTMIGLDLRPSLAAGDRDSIGTTGSNSSAQGSGWDSHRNERKTLRLTFGRDFTPRKSLRALVMEKSAKRQTLPESLPAESMNPQANSTEMSVNLSEPSVSNDVVDLEPEESHDVSKRRAALEAYFHELKDEIIARKQRMKEHVEQSLKGRQNVFSDFKFPPKSGFGARKELKPAPKKAKSKAKLSNALLSALPPDLRNYKPPKRFNKASWCTKRLYKFLETKLEPKYDYMARVRAENLVEKLYFFGKNMNKYSVASQESIKELKHEMARLKIVKTHFEFYDFFKEYMPKEMRIKVVPDCANKLPLPRDGVFADILRESVPGP